MSYSEDAVKAKLSSVQETADSITTVAQWIMFHRRNADRTAQLWLEKLKNSSSSKRLGLIYLVNEIVQQSHARKRKDFPLAFTPIIVEATVTAFKGANPDIQNKLNRVVGVWRDRAVFDPATLQEIETQVRMYDRSQQPERKARLGGSLMSNEASSTHPDLQPMITSHSAVLKQENPSITAAANAFAEYDKLTGSEASELPPPVQAGRLSTLLKSLASAENSVEEAVKARKTLIAELEKLMASQSAQLRADEDKANLLASQKAEIEAKKRTVEEEIRRSLENEGEPERPMAEPLTPPPLEVESLTPVGSPKPFDFGVMNMPATEQQPKQPEQGYRPIPENLIPTVPIASLDRPLNQAIPQPTVKANPRRSVSLNGDPRLAKRPRLGSAQYDDEFAAFADGGMNEIDQDVDAMLNRS